MLSSSTVGGEPLENDEDGEERAGSKGALAHVVGPGELGVRGAEKDAVSVGDGPDEDGRAVKRLKVGEGETEGGEASMTIAERLEALSEAIDHEAERNRPKGGVLALTGTGGAVQPRAESLSTVLTQALQSGDESLLEQCLAVGDQGVIEATVERLPSSKVLQFLLRYYRVKLPFRKPPRDAGASFGPRGLCLGTRGQISLWIQHTFDRSITPPAPLRKCCVEWLECWNALCHFNSSFSSRLALSRSEVL